MCSTTQCGLRRRRSNDEMRACRVATSATGPGKPYSKRPAGLTGGGAARGFEEEDEAPCGGGAKMADAGTGPGGPTVVVVAVAVMVLGLAAASNFLSPLRSEYMAAVAAAPAAALAAARTARVALDMVAVAGAARRIAG